MIEWRNIKKSFGPKEVLRGVDLKIPEGSLFGFAGVNGAGKSTLIKCFLGFLKPDSGIMTLENKPLEGVHFKSIIGYLPEVFQPPLDLKCCEFLNYAYSLIRKTELPKKEVEAVLQQVGLPGAYSMLIRQLSKGMRQRLGIAQAMVHSPKVLILDEPFSGLDPIGRFELKELFKSIYSQGKTLFFSSHNLSEIQDLCTHMAVLHKGRIEAMNTVDGLLQQYQCKSLEKVFLTVIGHPLNGENE